MTTDADGAYHLTELGHGLRPALEPLRAWAQRWSAELPAHRREP